MASTTQCIEEWPEWTSKVVCVAKKEAPSRPLIGTLLSEAERDDISVTNIQGKIEDIIYV